MHGLRATLLQHARPNAMAVVAACSGLRHASVSAARSDSFRPPQLRNGPAPLLPRVAFTAPSAPQRCSTVAAAGVNSVQLEGTVAIKPQAPGPVAGVEHVDVYLTANGETMKVCARVTRRDGQICGNSTGGAHGQRWGLYGRNGVMA